MKVILFGATGMVGQGVLRECLRDDSIERVLAIGRNSTGLTHPKLRELIRKDLFDFNAAGADLQGYDACFGIGRMAESIRSNSKMKFVPRRRYRNHCSRGIIRWSSQWSTRPSAGPPTV